MKYKGLISDPKDLVTKEYVDGAAQSAVSSGIGALDSGISATAASGNVYSVLTGVIQTDGKLTGKNEVTLSAIAKTGDVNDLIQMNGDVLVLSCGHAYVPL